MHDQHPCLFHPRCTQPRFHISSACCVRSSPPSIFVTFVCQNISLVLGVFPHFRSRCSVARRRSPRESEKPREASTTTSKREPTCAQVRALYEQCLFFSDALGQRLVGCVRWPGCRCYLIFHYRQAFERCGGLRLSPQIQRLSVSVPYRSSASPGKGMYRLARVVDWWDRNARIFWVEKRK